MHGKHYMCKLYQSFHPSSQGVRIVFHTTRRGERHKRRIDSFFFGVCVCDFFYDDPLPPKENHELAPLLFFSSRDDEDDGDEYPENVVSSDPLYGSMDDGGGGAVSAGGALLLLLLLLLELAKLGNNPPAVGGAVTSRCCICCCMAISYSSLVGGFCDIMRVNMIPIPSINANNTPPTTAALAMACGPARAAKRPPVVAPLMILFHGSSFCRTAVSVQSQQANKPPHTAN
mmetsp:Transcript_13982/g.26796  ORF Transcript_13982/g.26796 Transcript_13982/m.26796 type:complete len:230 (+) Transcript_13982:68-757(+)